MSVSKQSKGAPLLKAFIDRNGLTLRAAAEALDVSKTSLLFWLRGTQRPRFELRPAIEVWTNGEVPARSWLYPGEALAGESVRPFEPKQVA